MSERITKKFSQLNQENKKALISFITAGDPSKKIFEEILTLLPKSGVDLIEIGIPFSDPMADGPTIQNSSQRAIKSGIKLQNIISMVKKFRKTDKKTPIILMGYFNPIFQYGIKNFFSDSHFAGVDGVIVVDLPPEENDMIIKFSQEFQIDIIRLLTPTTDGNRLKKILKSTSGFLYYISIMGITGTKKPSLDGVRKAVMKIKKLSELPTVVGFGLNSAKQVQAINKFADGCVIGSAIVKIIEDFHIGNLTKKQMKHSINNFLLNIKKVC